MGTDIREVTEVRRVLDLRHMWRLATGDEGSVKRSSRARSRPAGSVSHASAVALALAGTSAQIAPTWRRNVYIPKWMVARWICPSATSYTTANGMRTCAPVAGTPMYSPMWVPTR